MLAWKRLWAMNDDIKGVFRLFTAPHEADTVKGGGAGHPVGVNNEGGGKDSKSYSITQLIGLILGPALFFLIYFFFKPEGLSAEGIAILASTVWIATWWITDFPNEKAHYSAIALPFRGGMRVRSNTEYHE